MKKHKKLIIILSIVAVVIAAAVVGLLILRSNLQKAPVYEVSLLNNGGFDSDTLYGTVSKSDNINFYLDSDKTVKEVFVKKGDAVQKGSPLFKYDTTVMEYSIKEKELDSERAKINLTKAQNTLQEYRNMPIIVPETDPPETDPPTDPPTEPPATDPSVPATGSTVPTEPAPAPTEPEPEPENDEPDEPQQDETAVKSFSSAAEKQQAINEQQVAVNEAQAALEAANVKLESLKKALANATVMSSIDGVVDAIQNPEDIENDKPFCTVKGKETMTVKGSLSEFDHSTTKVGDTITVTDFMNGNTSEAEIIKIDDYPMENGGSMMGGGNPNTSYYEMTAVIQQPEGFEVNAYVSMRKLTEETGAVTLPKVFVRKDKDGDSYVFKNQDGKLVKQTVTTEPSSQAGTVCITDGIAAEDFIAFPYGDRCKEGALTVETDPWAENNGFLSLFGG